MDGTRTIATAVAALDPRPQVLVCASGIDFYGGTRDEPVDESSLSGTGFLAEVALAWEAAAEPAKTAGVRVVHTRNGIVASHRGGAFLPLVTLFKLGLGGRMGSGKQYWSWISLVDEVRALRFLIDREDLSGAFNLTSPNPATNAEIARALGAALHRPTLIPVPAWALKLALGGLSIQVLGNKEVLPGRLLETGFEFMYPTIRAALDADLNE